MSRSQRPKHATRARRNAISQFLSPRKRTRPGLIAAIAAITTALLAATIAVVGVVGPASAHNGGVTGTAVCAADGTYTVTWTYTQTNTPDDNEADVTVSAHTPEPSFINGVDGIMLINATVAHRNTNGQTNIPTKKGNWSTTFTQTGISGSSRQAAVKVDTTWPAWGSSSAQGQVNLTGNCAPQDKLDASASVHVTQATCDAAATLVLDTHVNSTFGTPTYPTATSYSVTATATAGHKFADGDSTKTFTGTLPARITGDACLTPVTVTAVVTVTPPSCDVAGSLVVPMQTGVVFTGGTNGAGPGTYTVVASAAPGYKLTAPYSVTVQVKGKVTGVDCYTVVAPVAPILTHTAACDTYGSVSPVAVTGVVYATTFDKNTGDYTVIATPAAGYKFAGASQSVTYTGNVGQHVDCIVQPGASIASGLCVYGADGTGAPAKVEITFDNSKSDVAVDFAVKNHPELAQNVKAHDSVTFTVPAPYAASYTVTANGKSFVLAVTSCPDHPLTDRCTTTAGVKFTDLSGLAFADGTQGDHELVAGGLHISATGPAGSQSVAAATIATDFALKDAGVPTLNVTTTSGASAALTLALKVNGSVQGTLVQDAASSKYAANFAIAGLPAGPAAGQLAYGTLDEILAAYADHGVTDVRVGAAGYLLGAVGDNTVNSITAGCTTYTFDTVPVVIPTEPKATDEACNTNDGTAIPGFIVVTPVDHVTYSIVGTSAGSTVNIASASAKTIVPAGDYTVTAKTAPGFTLGGVTSWPFTIAASLDCLQLPTHPEVIPTLSTKQPTCDAGGSYTLDDIVVDGVRAVLWTVDGKSVEPGTYQVEAGKTVQVHAATSGPDFGFGFDTQVDWALAFDSAQNCDQLTTLAFTGANGELGGLMLAGLLLMVAGAGVFTAGRYRARAK